MQLNIKLFSTVKKIFCFQIIDKSILFQEGEAILKFRNPLPVPLNNGKFFITGLSMPKTLEIKVG